MPNEKTAQMAYDNLDFQRGVRMAPVPTYVMIEAIWHVSAEPGELVLAERLMENNHSSKKWEREPMLHFNGMRSAVMESGLINLKK